MALVKNGPLPPDEFVEGDERLQPPLQREKAATLPVVGRQPPDPGEITANVNLFRFSCP